MAALITNSIGLRTRFMGWDNEPRNPAEEALSGRTLCRHLAVMFDCGNGIET